jgi:hypothetical protein
VRVDKIKCIKSSDSTDKIYFIVFRGRMAAPFNSNVGIVEGGTVWDDFDDDDEWTNLPLEVFLGNEKRLAGFTADSVYVVLLMEQDSGNDSNNRDDLARWRNITSLAWRTVRGAQTLAGLPDSAATRTAAANAVADGFETARGATQILEDPDDEMGPPRRLVVTPGTRTTMNFNEVPPDGRYRVSFIVK